jgi:hypothetical protein
MRSGTRALTFGITLLATVATGMPVAHAAGQFTTVSPGVTISLYGTGSVRGGGLFGGVAFASDGSPIVDECHDDSPLHRFDAATTVPTTHGTTTLHQEQILPSAAGCGLVNHPDGTLYSNTSRGVTNLDPVTGMPIRTIGQPGNRLGIAVDPQTDRLVYVGSGCNGSLTATCTLLSTDPVTNTTTTFAVLPPTESQFLDGIAFDPTGNYLFLSNPLPSERVTILDRLGVVVQDVPMPQDPDGIAFHVGGGDPYVLVNANDGSLDRLDFPNQLYALPPAITTVASGGFRGDLLQVGPDGCVYATQHGTRYDDGTVDGSHESLVQVCPGFAPPPGVGNGDLTGHAVALGVRSPVVSRTFGDTGYISTSVASHTAKQEVAAGVSSPVTISETALDGTVDTSPASGSSAEARVADVTILLAGGIVARGVVATSATTCTGSTGASYLASLTVNGQTTAVSTAPNTVIPLPGGVGTVTVNEQVETVTPATGSRVLTVNALHVVIPGVLDVVVASATSDVHHC